MDYLLQIFAIEGEMESHHFRSEDDFSAIDYAHDLVEKLPFFEDSDYFELYALEGEIARRVL